MATAPCYSLLGTLKYFAECSRRNETKTNVNCPSSEGGAGKHDDNRPPSKICTYLKRHRNNGASAGSL